MSNYPLLDEHDQAQAAILEECGGDLRVLLQRLRIAECNHPERVVTAEDVARAKQASGTRTRQARAPVPVIAGWDDQPLEDSPIIQEVRQIRAKILRECGGDLMVLLDKIKAQEALHPERMISPEELRRIQERSDRELDEELARIRADSERTAVDSSAP